MLWAPLFPRRAPLKSLRRENPDSQEKFSSGHEPGKPTFPMNEPGRVGKNSEMPEAFWRIPAGGFCKSQWRSLRLIRFRVPASKTFGSRLTRFVALTGHTRARGVCGGTQQTYTPP